MIGRAAAFHVVGDDVGAVGMKRLVAGEQPIVERSVEGVDVKSSL